MLKTSKLPTNTCDFIKFTIFINLLNYLFNLIFQSNALARSVRIRKACEFLPEDSVKARKAFFCKENEGYFSRKVGNTNPMAMMNPDMMSNMMKQNV
jgi:hypothetical protein